MLDITISIERRDVGERSHATAARAAMLAVANEHIFRTIGDHFKEGPKTAPGGAYGFKQRNQQYLKRIDQLKKREPNLFAEAGKPLTFTGKLKRFIKNNAEITATQYQSRIVLHAPHILKPEQWAELTAISDDEIQKYTVLANEVYQQTLKELGARKSRKRIA